MRKLCSRCVCHPLVLVVAAVLLWLFGGMVCYWLLANCSDVPEFDDQGGIHIVTYCPWTFAQSFYYAVQAGLSIGFGLLSETSERSRLFTVMYILVGSSVIAGALACFVQISLLHHRGWQSREERRLAKFSSSIHADGYRGFDLREVRELLVCYPSHMRDLYMRLESDYCVVNERMQAFSEAGLRRRAKLADEALKEACEKLGEFDDSRLTIKELLQLHQQEATPLRRCYGFLLRHRNMLRQLVAMFLWIALGVVYICVAEGASFVTGLYFAVSSLSTAGLYSITSTSNGSAYWFTGVFCLIGVPLYAMLLGSYANILLEEYNREQMMESLHKRMGGAEVAFLQHLVQAEHRQRVSFGDYAEFQLLRLGKVDRDLLRQLRSDFSELDKEGVGRVPLESFLSPPQKEQLRQLRAQALPDVGSSSAALGLYSEDGRAQEPQPLPQDSVAMPECPAARTVPNLLFCGAAQEEAGEAEVFSVQV